MATESSVMALIRAYRPHFRNAHDKIPFALNASFLAAGYVLTATGNRAFSASPPSEEEVGIDGWNELDDCYGFIYKKAGGGSKKFVIVKCLVMGENLVIDAMCHGEEKREPINLQINVNDFVSDEASSSTNYEKIYKNFPSLVDCLQSGILDKLENTVKRDSASASSSEANQTILQVGSVPKHHEDRPDVDILTEPQPYPPGFAYPPVFPVGIDDLLPGPPAGVFPTRGGFGIGGGIGGGMLVGPDDPRWHGGVGRAQPGFPGGLPGVPPGSRFDPIGPPNVLGFEPERFIRNPRRPGGGGGGHPDSQHFPGGHDYYL
eukprot:TRINITY_DN48920_c0_g1_i1.p1 TRINITY_DN48920_c0_g1~~TRINITY_DN48920_c0_g1_i1.p1  ORF type:complete len:318 (-),score=68.31 TRINITY_DN48920_c0_g1_i1:255-1208(-)